MAKTYQSPIYYLLNFKLFYNCFICLSGFVFHFVFAFNNLLSHFSIVLFVLNSYYLILGAKTVLNVYVNKDGMKCP